MLLRNAAGFQKIVCICFNKAFCGYEHPCTVAFSQQVAYDLGAFGKKGSLKLALFLLLQRAYYLLNSF
jgi:hypothetical protein